MPRGEGAPPGAPRPRPELSAVPLRVATNRLCTLGRLELLADAPDGAAERVMGPSKPLALLAYLALAPRHRATRDRLVALLWSDADPERGRRTLRQTVWSLRQRLGEEALQTAGDEVVLAQPLTVDAARFVEAVAAKALAEAWALYRGPFIPDFALSGGAQFEHWADARRAELHAAWRAVGLALAGQALDEARPRDAVPVLRMLVDADPSAADAPALLLDALMAEGDRVHALREAERLERLLERAGVRPSAALRATVLRVRRAAALPFATTPVAGDGPRRPEMVGREATFAALLAGWRRATAGGGTVQVMRAAAGLGKTRLLTEVQQRLEDMGAAVVAVRARRADRDIPYALAATLAAALASRAGAAGVSPATASALVALDPGLSGVFPSAAPVSTADAEVLRVRTLAMEELLRAVTDEAPVAVLVDDVHWGDEPSRQLVASMADRVTDLPLLVVLAMRPLRGDWPTPASATAVELLPLSPDQLEGLLASMARGTPALLAELARALHAASGGIPLLAVAALDLAQERGWLRIDGDAWQADAPERLGAALADGSVLEQLLRDLPADALGMLVALAQVRGPLSSAVLRQVAGTAEAGGVLETLEQRGLVLPAGPGWEVAHDRLADAALEVVPMAQRHAVTDRLVRALLADPTPSARTWQVAGRLLMPLRPADAAQCFRRWVEQTGGRAAWRDPLAAAAAFLGPEARVPEVQQLARRIPLRARLRRGYPMATLGVGAALLAIAASVLTLAGQRWLAPRAARLEVVEPTASRGFLWGPVSDEPGHAPPRRAPVPLRVSFRDASNRPTANSPSMVRVRVVEGNGTVQLHGVTTAPVRDGEATFDDLTVSGSGGFRLEVGAGALPVARTRRLYAAMDGPVPDARVRLLGGTVNGQPVDSLRREVRVRPGAPLIGTVTFQTLTDVRDAAMLFGGVALWGDRRTQAHALQALPPHGTATFRESLDDKISGHRWVAPGRPGRYAILFGFDTETEMRFIASSTSWVLGTPRWNDGNDLADMTDTQLRQLEREGRLFRAATQFRGRLPLPPAGAPPTQEWPQRLVGTILWVTVAPD